MTDKQEHQIRTLLGAIAGNMRRQADRFEQLCEVIEEVITPVGADTDKKEV